MGRDTGEREPGKGLRWSMSGDACIPDGRWMNQVPMERVIWQGWTAELAESSANGCMMDLDIDTEKERSLERNTKKLATWIREGLQGSTWCPGTSKANGTSLRFVCLLVGCLTPQQHASVSQGRICSDNFTCCHTEIEVADPTFYLTQSQYTNTGPTSPSADPIMPGAWQGSHWSANF